MRQKKLLVIGFLVFSILTVSDFAFRYLYHERAFKRHERCQVRKNELSDTADLCDDIYSAADNAFSDATSNHLLTYFALFALFSLVVSKLDMTEKRLKELEDRTNV